MATTTPRQRRLPPHAHRFTLALQAVYLKDCSFEAPQGPRVNGEWNPQISLDLNTSVQPLAGDVREVVLTVTVSAKQGEQTMFLVEVKQAGAFLMQNLSAGRVQARRRQHLPERAVPVRARRGLAAGQPGRLSAAAAAAGELRRAVRQRAAEPTAPQTSRDPELERRRARHAAADIAVLGAGSWGTALAIQCARAGRRRGCGAAIRAQIASMARERVNRRYLPEAPLPR